MSFFGRLVKAGRRLDRAVSERTGLGRAISSTMEKIPTRVRRYSPFAAIILAVALFAAALSGTEQTNRQVGTGAKVEGGAPVAEPGAPATGTTQAGSDQSAAGGSRSSRGASRVGGASGSTSSLAGGIGPGITSNTIALGYVYPEDLAATNQAAGLSELAIGDNKAMFQAMADHLNAKGGVAGRKLSPVYFTFRTADNFGASAQAACSYFTEDHKVFFVFGNLFEKQEDQLAACLSKRNTVLVAYSSGDEKEFQRLAPYFYAPIGLNMTRKSLAFVEGLAEQGYFELGAKIGLLRFDFPGYRRATEEEIKPALSARGIKLIEDIEVPAWQSTGDPAASQISAAVLRMRQSGVTHVMLLDVDGGLALLFMPAAESQGYRPRYGLESDSFPYFIAANLPKEQFRRALGVGWQLLPDVGRDLAPMKPPRASCLAIMKKAGVQMADSSAEHNALRECDKLSFFAKAAGGAQVLNAAAVKTAVEALGTGFDAATNFANWFAPGRYDGVAAVSNFFFDDGCSCFKYRGQPRSIQ